MLLDEMFHLSAAIALSLVQVWLTCTRSQLDKRLENKIESQTFISVIFPGPFLVDNKIDSYS